MIGVDKKEFTDSAGQRYFGLNVVDMATRFSLILFLANERSAETARAFREGWMSWAGAPDTVLADQGAEFRKDFLVDMERFGIKLRLTATEAPWQHGVTERHGKVSAEIV